MKKYIYIIAVITALLASCIKTNQYGHEAKINQPIPAFELKTIDKTAGRLYIIFSR